jgi:hypothetical protein
MFKYFNYAKYKSEEDMMKKMNNKKKYPLINQFLKGNKDIQKLEYLPAFIDLLITWWIIILLKYQEKMQEKGF